MGGKSNGNGPLTSEPRSLPFGLQRVGEEVQCAEAELAEESWNNTVTSAGLLRLLEQQDGRCALTGRELTPNNCSVDHRVPIAQGGAIGMSNCQLVVAGANAAKGTMTQDEFISLCRDVAATH